MNAAGKDKPDGDKSKPAKSNDHVEVLLKVTNSLYIFCIFVLTFVAKRN